MLKLIQARYEQLKIRTQFKMEEFLLALKLSKMLIHARCEQLNIREEKYSRSRIRVLEWPPRRNNISATPSLQHNFYLHSKALDTYYPASFLNSPFHVIESSLDVSLASRRVPTLVFTRLFTDWAAFLTTALFVVEQYLLAPSGALVVIMV